MRTRVPQAETLHGAAGAAGTATGAGGNEVPPEKQEAPEEEQRRVGCGRRRPHRRPL